MPISDWSSDVCSSDLEAAHSCLVEAVHQVRAGNEHAFEAFQLSQELVDLTGFPRSVGAAPILQEAVDLVDLQYGILACGLLEGSRQLLLHDATERALQIRNALEQDRSVEGIGKPAHAGGLSSSSDERRGGEECVE